MMFKEKMKRRKMMNEEEIKRIIEEYLKGNLRLEAKSRYLDTLVITYLKEVKYIQDGMLMVRVY